MTPSPSARSPLDEFFAAVPEADVLSALPDGARVTFDLLGDDGGLWTVSRNGGSTAIERTNHDAPVDCRLRCTVGDFRALVRGELDPRQGFMERRLEVEGDVGLVLRLQRTVVRSES
ncbi:MAG: SCP2 sterol-binding domain-containing protein [Alphaproteobacteria bacterium]|nr:SCP2 sterol-binding domain-containing protein [Alphaproteobacteria bacterium]MCB9698303.1 SCP2 sterol-binding domain-containing protein [Alphaproteobacteria bacterium]